MRWFTRSLFLTLFLLLPTLFIQSAGAQSTAAQPTDGDILITGRVTDEETGAPLANVYIVLYEPPSPIDGASVAKTDSSGYYTVTQPSVSRWWLRFEPENRDYIAEYYDNFPVAVLGSPYYPAPDEAPIFEYKPGMVLHGIDAALAKRGNSEIRGVVSQKSDGAPILEVTVDVYEANGRLRPEFSRYTDQNGEFIIEDLAPGTYKVHFTPSPLFGRFYLPIYYGESTTLAGAETVELGENEILEDVNVALSAGGVITGFVTTSPNGWSMQDTWYLYPKISAYDESGKLVTAYRDTFAFHPYYTLPNLPAGQYRLLFEEIGGSHHSEYYSDQQSLDKAQFVTVKANEITANINVTLTYTSRVAAIATSKALPNSIVVAVDNDPAVRFTMDGGMHWGKVPTTPWQEQTVGIANPYAGIAFGLGLAPREELSGRRMLVRFEKKIYRSGDLGETWSAETPHLPCEGQYSYPSYPSFSTLSTSPADANRLYVIEDCTVQGEGSSSHYLQLSKSTDAGVSWQPLHVMSDGVELKSIAQVVSSPVKPDRLYVLTGDPYYAAQWFESNDNGAQWAFRDFPVSSVVPDGQNAESLYGWSTRHTSGLYYSVAYYVGMRSEDGGDHWVEWAQQPCQNWQDALALVAYPAESRILFLNCNSGFFRSEDGGDHWSQLATEPWQFFTTDLGVPGRLLAAKDGELWGSTNKGESWQLLMDSAGMSPNQNRVPLYLPNISSHQP